MSTGANLRSIGAIRDFRAALIGFIEDAKLALMEAHSDVMKTTMWIENDRIGHWQQALRKRHEKVQQCKSDLYRAQMQSRDERPSCVVERKALAKAEAECDEAQRKIDACKRAVALLDREGLLFKAALAGFSTSLELDLPNAVAHLDRLMDTIQKYLSLVAPSDGAVQGTTGGAAGDGASVGGTGAADAQGGSMAPREADDRRAGGSSDVGDGSSSGAAPATGDRP
ncbi:MAG: hypothetical protein U0575_09840 [Phycisphaerales bacterium]